MMTIEDFASTLNNIEVLLKDTELGETDRDVLLKYIDVLQEDEPLISYNAVGNISKYGLLETLQQGHIVHEKQIDFHKDTHRNRWVLGGNRTGKTECGAVEALWYAQGVHPFKEVPKKSVGWIVSLSSQVQRDVAQKKFLTYLPKRMITDITMSRGRADKPANGWIDTITIKNLHGEESKIGFKVCEQGYDKFQGTSQDWIWFDEEPPLDVYTECVMRTIDVKGNIWGTMTPLKGLTWVYNQIYKNKPRDPEVKYWAVSWEDNPFLPQDELKRLEGTMTKSDREARQHGRFIAKTGMVYPEFDHEIHVIKPFEVPKAWYSGICIDPGLNDPLSCHWYAQDFDGNIYVIAEHYQANMIIKEHARIIREKSIKMGWMEPFEGYTMAYIDPSSNARVLPSATTTVEMFYEHGIVCNTNVNNAILAGINQVRMYLEPREVEDKIAYPKGKPRLFFFDTCYHMIDEIEELRYSERDQEMPDPNCEDHACDDLRYFMMTKPNPALMDEKPKTLVQLDLERSIRRMRSRNLYSKRKRKGMI